MVYEAGDIHKIETIFANWEETLIWSCLQNVMGKVFVTNNEIQSQPVLMWDALCFSQESQTKNWF